MTTPFPIVGVGASAGGIAATTQLLRHLGPAPGCALVIIHHLDPTHESSLAEIFSRATLLPVHTATNGMRVQPNQVYLLPPNATLTISDGVLVLGPRDEPTSVNRPIDRFFETLATDRAASAVGVVLTGTGSDGTRGLQRIKHEGGVTFAQDATAEYRGMPESAVAMGCVDYVMPPDEIARALVRLAEVPPSVELADADAPIIKRILLSLRRTSGVDFTHYKPSTVRRRIQRRLAVRGLPDLSAYAQFLDDNSSESAALCEDVLIHVTSFFRDPEVFVALREQVFPKLLDKRPRDAEIRVWVPGCSTGEEVYSIAICLLEFLDEHGAKDVTIKVFGTDVSQVVVDRARAGRYASSIERDVSQERLQRFFTFVDGVYQIRKHVRDLCVFAKQDATRDPPFSGLDLISCRNLLIYLGSALQERLLPIFHYALKEPGFLVLGSAETTGAFPGFSVLDAGHKIYSRSSAAPRVLLEFGTPWLVDPVPPRTRPGAGTSGALDVHREADRLVLAEYGPPGVVVTEDLAIVQFRGKTGPFLEPTPGVASFDLIRMVREELRLPLRQALDEARTSRSVRRRASLRAGPGESARTIELEVVQFKVATNPQRFFVVLFNEPAARPSGETLPLTAADEPPLPSAVEVQLAQELTSTRDYLQSLVEQLEASNEELSAANEEIVSNNEELRSTNEELQMAKEELQATNEELRTVNEEMTVRNLESSRLNDDLSNVLSSVEIPIVILGRDLRLRRFTPAAAKLLRLAASDIGRPISEIALLIPPADLSGLILEVLQSFNAISRTERDSAGHWYQLVVRPYVTTDNRIDGAVITLFDIEAVKQREVALGEARQYAESIVDTVPAALLVLDAQLRVRSANRTFAELFGASSAALEGRDLREMNAGAWAIPELIQGLEGLDEADPLLQLKVEREFEPVGLRSLALRAKHIAHSQSILLAIEDLTESKRSRQQAERTEIAFRDVLTTAAEAIVMSEPSGKIVFANQAAVTMFGFGNEELLAGNVDMLVPDALRAIHTRHRADYLAAPAPRPMGRDRQLSGRRKDGSEFPIEVILSVLPREGGALVVSFIEDVTVRRNAENTLREYQEQLQRLSFDRAVAEEHERRRIASGLHDRIGQSLALAQIKLTAVRAAIAGEPRSAIDAAIALLEQSASDTRTLIFELSPPVLYDLGLKEALAWLAEDLETRHGIHVDIVDDELPKPLDDATAALVFRATRELLVNVLKHADTPRASVSLRRVGETVELAVEDAGLGFDLTGGQSVGSGFGLFSVREQIGRLGGSVQVVSAPKCGTKVSLCVPLKRRAEVAARQVEEP